jgi:hypothetical protein
VTQTTITTVTEHVHRVTASYRVSAFRGSDESAAGACVVLQERAASYTVLTASDQPPVPDRFSPQERGATSHDVQVTWILQQLSASRQLQFAVDRGGPGCRTPRRNPEIAAAVHTLSRLERWAQIVAASMRRLLGAKAGRCRPPPKTCGTGGHPLHPRAMLRNVCDVCGRTGTEFRPGAQDGASFGPDIGTCILVISDIAFSYSSRFWE